MGSRDRCVHVIQILIIVIALCVFEPVGPHSSAESIHRKFNSPQTQLAWRWILPFWLIVGDMIYDDSGVYLTDPCKCNCFAEIWVDCTLILKIIHWDLHYNAYQHPDDLMVKCFEWQTKEQRKMQQLEKCMQITWTFHNFCSKESSICRQHIF